MAAGLVWTIGQDGTLSGLDPSTGAVRQRAAVGAPANHFPTPSVGDGLLLAASADPGGGLQRLVVPPCDLAERVHVEPVGHGRSRSHTPRAAAGSADGLSAGALVGIVAGGLVVLGVAGRLVVAPAARAAPARAAVQGVPFGRAILGRWPGPGSETAVPVARALRAPTSTSR